MSRALSLKNISAISLGCCLIFLAGCIADPVTSPVGTADATAHGALVVNEGLWGQDNASLTLYDPATGITTQDYFAVRNPGMRLGDIANGITIYGNHAYIPVTTSQNIEVVELPSGKSLGHIRMPDGDQPRQVAMLNDSIGFATAFIHDEVVKFNSRTLAILRKTAVGPNPEGIVIVGGRVWAANSGYGLLRAHEPLASTISVLDANSLIEDTLLVPGPNPIGMVVFASRERIYCEYGMPDPDSLGGIIEYDAVTRREVRRWPLMGTGVAPKIALDTVSNLLYVRLPAGLARIDLASGTVTPAFVSSAPYSSLGFYSLGVRPTTGEIYTGYTSSFSLPGKVASFSRAGTFIGTFATGLNPGWMGFY